MTDDRQKIKPLKLVETEASPLAVRPLFVTKANSEAVTGFEFRRWKDHFPALVRRVGRKDVIVASELERAVQNGLRQALETPEAEAMLDAAEQVRDLLRRCENVRRAGAR